MQDQTLQANGFPIDAIVEDRKTLLSSDAFRSFVFITISFILILVFLRVAQIKFLNYNIDFIDSI